MSFKLPLILLLRFVAFALAPKPMISAVRIALLPLPFWPISKFVRGLKSTVRFEWHIKFRNFTVNIFPLRTLRFNPPTVCDDTLFIDSLNPSSVFHTQWKTKNQKVHSKGCHANCTILLKYVIFVFTYLFNRIIVILSIAFWFVMALRATGLTFCHLDLVDAITSSSNIKWNALALTAKWLLFRLNWREFHNNRLLTVSNFDDI